MKTLILIILLSLFNATVIITFRKWGVFEYIHTYKPVWLKWYPDCEFCYGFQLAVLESIAFCISSPSWLYIAVPLCCASLTYKLTQ